MADRGEHHARQPHVAGKAVRAIDFGGQIKPRKGRGFLGIGAERFFTRRLGAQRRGIGGRVTCRRLGQFAKACALGGVSDKSALDLAFLVGNPPARGGFLRQHRARGGSGFAAGLFVGGKRCAIGGRSEALRAGKALGHQRIGARREPGKARIPQRDPLGSQRDIAIGARNRRRFDRDLPPVRAEFISDDLRQQRGDALPHLELRDSHRHHTIGRDLEPCAEHVLAARGDQRGAIRARHQPPRHQQPPAHSSPGQQPAPRNFHA